MTRETSCYRSSYRRDATDELRKSSKRDASGVRRVRVRDRESVTTERNCTRHCSLPADSQTRLETCRVQGAGERERRERVEHSCCVKDAPRERGRRSLGCGENGALQKFCSVRAEGGYVQRGSCVLYSCCFKFQLSRCDDDEAAPRPTPPKPKDGAFSTILEWNSVSEWNTITDTPARREWARARPWLRM